jgi:hypothetical protein
VFSYAFAVLPGTICPFPVTSESAEAPLLLDGDALHLHNKAYQGASDSWTGPSRIGVTWIITWSKGASWGPGFRVAGYPVLITLRWRMGSRKKRWSKPIRKIPPRYVVARSGNDAATARANHFSCWRQRSAGLNRRSQPGHPETGWQRRIGFSQGFTGLAPETNSDLQTLLGGKIRMGKVPGQSDSRSKKRSCQGREFVEID